MARESLPSALSTRLKARTTAMPCTYSRIAPTMARCAVTRRLDMAWEPRCMRALMASTQTMAATTTKPQRQSITLSMTATMAEKTRPEMTLEYTRPPTFCTSSRVLVMVLDISPRLFLLK